MVDMPNKNTPITAVIMANMNGKGVTSTNTSIGFMTYIKGTRNPAKASFTAVMPVFIGSAPAMPAPAYAAKATGGLKSAAIPK